MKTFAIAAFLTSALIGAAVAHTPDFAYVDAVQQWRDAREKSLRNDNGWLTLAGRFQMKPGEIGRAHV